jgi:hypothetical protein
MPGKSRGKHPSQYPALLLIAVSALLAAAPACTRGCKTPAPPSPSVGAGGPAQQRLQVGDTPFAFDYHSVTELLIVKADPESGDRWAAHLTRRDAKTDEWEIHSAGGNVPPLDTVADGYLALHLLDTLRTLRVERVDVPGPHESLGLAPPRFALQWRASTLADPKTMQGFELRIGSPVSKDRTQGAYAWYPGQPTFAVSGATLQMLEYLSSFASLRLKTWAGVTSDDVDEIEIPGGAEGRKPFYAQREGADWTGRDHHPLKADVSAWLDRLVHQRVRNFVDDQAIAEGLRLQLHQGSTRRVTLKDRHGRAVELEAGKVGGKTIALSSARPHGVFEVFPESISALEPPRR